ncbi:hypothetical protein D9M68_820800 [compost metagenome]
MALALTEGQPQQTHENRQVVATARLHGQSLLDQQLKQLLKADLGIRLGLTAIQLALEATAERPEKT